jgi:transcriptional regulator with XRE-family HTH domain
LQVAPPAVSPIAHRRFLLRLSQSDLAVRAGVSRETISLLERGDLPRLDTAYAIAGALSADIATLFPESEERQAASPDALKNSGGQARHAEG